MKIAILGAGSTIGTLGRLDLGVEGFMDRIESIWGAKTPPRDPWAKEYDQIKRASDDCGSRKLDRLWTHADYAGKFHRALGDNPYPRISGQLRRALLDAYALQHEVQQIPKDASFHLKTELQSLGDGGALISFNWDVVAEHVACEIAGRKLVAAGPALASSGVNLIKPHGSLSWKDLGAGRGVEWEHSGRPILKPMGAMKEGHDYPHRHD